MRDGHLRRAIVALTLAVLPGLTSLTIMSPAAADHVSVADADDSLGRLDVKTAHHGHHTTVTGRRLLKHRITTYETWRNVALSRDNTYVTFYLHPSDGKMLRWVRVHAKDDGTLIATMLKGPEPNTDVIGPVRVWRHNRRSLTIAFPKRHLGKGVDSYRWDVLTSWQVSGSDSCGEPTEFVAPAEPTCPDRTTRVRHNLN